MWLLHQFPLCPFSRKVRLCLGEKGVAYDLIVERPWEMRDEFQDLNPASETPVLVDPDKGITLIDSTAICEYFEETVERSPLLAGPALQRAEARRLVAWLDHHFYGLAVHPMMTERLRKRLDRQTPDAGAIREAMRWTNRQLDYLDYLLDHRAWLAGPRLSLADLTAAAHLSVADYLGAVDWRAHEPLRRWYSGLKSRPSFRPLLAERMSPVDPPKHYDKVDFD